MPSVTPIELGDPLPLSCTLITGASGLFPQAFVYDSTGAPVAGSPFDLAEVGATGRYTNQAFTPTTKEVFTALFVVFTDAPHTTESALHGRHEEMYLVSILEDLLTNIAVTGAAINQTADSVDVTTGTPTGILSNTFGKDNLYYQVAIAAGEMDFYYEFLIGSDGVPTGMTHFGRVDRTGGASTFVGVFAWNWITFGWDQVGALVSTNNSSALDNVSTNFALLTSHVGTGANLGKVRCRFFATGMTRAEEIYTDQIFVSYAVVYRSVGYAQGAIWIDTVNGSPGVVPFFNGVADNPVDNLADATTLSVALGINRFRLAPGSSITLAQAYDNFTFSGAHWYLALGGQSISEAGIFGANVSGTCVAAGGHPHFHGCFMGIVTLPMHHFHNCALEDAITLAEAGAYFWDQCYSGVAGTATPSVSFFGLGAIQLNMRHYSGGIEIENMAAGDLMSLEGEGQYIIAASCSGGVLAPRGNFDKTDNAGGAVTESDDARVTQSSVRAAIMTYVLDGNILAITMEEAVDFIRKVAQNRMEQADGDTNNLVLYDDDDLTPLFTWDSQSKSGGPISQPLAAPAKRIP